MNRHSLKLIVVLAMTACGGASASAAPTTPTTSSAPSTPTATGTGATAQPTAAMGVEAKRRMKDFQEKHLPSEVARFKASCGYEVAVDVDWNSFGNDAEAIRALGSNRAMGEINEAFHRVCRDAAGKEGAQKKVQRIAFKNIPNRADKKMVLENGVLKVDCAFEIGKLVEGTFPSQDYLHYLEKQL